MTIDCTNDLPTEPCPFCGGQPRVSASGDPTGWGATAECLNRQCPAFPLSVNGGGRGADSAVQSAVARWNQRAK